MLEASLEVERVPIRSGELPGCEHVDADPDESDDKDRPAARRGRRNEVANCAVDDQEREHQQRRAVGLRGEDLRAAQPERPVATYRLRRKPKHDKRHRERAGVGEHVRRVGEERERVREDADRDLAGHEGGDQRDLSLLRERSPDLLCDLPGVPERRLADHE